MTQQGWNASTAQGATTARSTPRARSLVGEVELAERAGRRAPTARAVERIAAERDALRARLREHGALRLRGIAMDDPARDLAELAAAFAGSAPLDYVGGDSPRTRVRGQVYTSTEMPPDVPLALHNELSYTAHYPRLLFFHCVTPAPEGGASTLADGAAVLGALDPAVRERLITHGVRYDYAYPGASRLVSLANRVVNVNKTWMDVYETDDPREAEARCRAVGLSPRWDRGRLAARTTLPGAIAHPATGEMVWFNQAHLFELTPRAIGWRRYAQARVAFLHPAFRTRGAAFGDGSPMTRAVLEHILDVLEACTVELELRAGDTLVLDNIQCLHGRRPFRGARRLLVTMTG